MLMHMTGGFLLPISDVPQSNHLLLAQLLLHQIPLLRRQPSSSSSSSPLQKKEEMVKQRERWQEKVIVEQGIAKRTSERTGFGLLAAIFCQSSVGQVLVEIPLSSLLAVQRNEVGSVIYTLRKIEP